MNLGIIIFLGLIIEWRLWIKLHETQSINKDYRTNSMNLGIIESRRLESTKILQICIAYTMQARSSTSLTQLSFCPTIMFVWFSHAKNNISTCCWFSDITCLMNYRHGSQVFKVKNPRDVFFQSWRGGVILPNRGWLPGNFFCLWHLLHLKLK